MTNGAMSLYNVTHTSPDFYRQHAPLAPPQQSQATPSGWLDFYRKIKEPEVVTPVQSAVTGLRHNGEGAIVGGLLGLVHGEFGTLDIRGKYPVDGIAALLLYALSIRDSGKPDGLASDFRALSQSCTTTLFYRKAREWRERAKASGKGDVVPSRSTSVDPIIAAANRLKEK